MLRVVARTIRYCNGSCPFRVNEVPVATAGPARHHDTVKSILVRFLRYLDWAIVLAGILSTSYLILFQEEIAERLGRTTTVSNAASAINDVRLEVTSLGKVPGNRVGRISRRITHISLEHSV